MKLGARGTVVVIGRNNDGSDDPGDNCSADEGASSQASQGFKLATGDWTGINHRKIWLGYRWLLAGRPKPDGYLRRADLYNV